MIIHVHTVVLGVGDVVPLYVLGHGAETVRDLLPDDVCWVLQADQRGTGHAVSVALEAVATDVEEVMVLYGDMPLLTSHSLQALRDTHRQRGAHLTVLSAVLESPTGYGRIVRDAQGRPQQVIEEKWLTTDQRQIREVNSGVYVIAAPWLRATISTLPTHGDNELYLTDLVAFAAQDDGLTVLEAVTPEEVLGVNDRVALAQAEAVMRQRVNERAMHAGVTLVDPATAYIAADASIGMDTIIEPNVWIGAGVSIGEHCLIGANSRIVGSAIGNHCVVHASVIEFSELEDHVHMGPFCHLRPGARLGQDVHLGNFAEVKNSVLGAGTHMGHFSYVGDATIGEKVNIGAGTVTVNYDGRQKHHTTVGDGASIGAGTMLRAPITVGAGATTGTGSVVLSDVQPESTVVGVPARPIARHGRGAEEVV
jgi:bifunctional UDP-N-acetylglucosamine pyrophosphorylase/glucosamine-1-phosphate N-acetyltransferase